MSANKRQQASGGGMGTRAENDGYRLQIHFRDGCARLYRLNGANWSDRYPLIAEATRLKGSAILDVEVVCPDSEGVSDFGILRSRCFDQLRLHARATCSCAVATTCAADRLLSKKLCAPSVWAVEELDQDQESEIARSNACF